MFSSFSCVLGVLLWWFLSSVVRLLAAAEDFFLERLVGFNEGGTDEYVFSGKIESKDSHRQFLLGL
jgi:hypothetical protein